MRRDTKEAFRWIVKILRKHKIPFQVSGGFAAIIYGSCRLLADIDIEIPDRKFKALLPDVKKYIIYGPKRYTDKNFDLTLVTLKYKGQKIDISGCEKDKIFDRKNKKWVASKTYLSKVERKKIFGLIVPVIYKKDLINYKTKIARRVDLRDVKSISPSQNHPKGGF